jgi:VanZ family protein
MNRRLALPLWLLACTFIVYGSLTPFQFDRDATTALAHLREVDLNPLIAADTGDRVSLPDVAQNLLLYLPFGICGAVALRRRRPTAPIVAIVAASALALSAAVELLQLFTADRVTSTKDLLWNTVGAAAGAFAAVEVEGLTAAIDRALVELFSRATAAYQALVTLVVVICTATEPFDATLDVGVVWPRIKSLRLDPWQARAASAHAPAAVEFFAFGLCAALFLRQLRVRRPAAVAALGAVAIASTLEVSRLFVQSRMPGLSDVLVNGASAFAGVVLAGWRPLQPRTRAVVLCAAFVAATAVYEVGASTASTPDVSGVIQGALLFFSLGFWLSQTEAGARAKATGLLTVLIAAFYQFWSLGPSGGLAHVLPAAIGSAVGWQAGRTGGAWLIAEPVPR